MAHIITGYALNLAIFTLGEDVAAPVGGGIVGAQLFRVVSGQGPFTESDPFPHVAEEDRAGDTEPADDLEDIEALPQLHAWLVPVIFLHIILSG